jgi:hypothetical protein
MRSFLVLVLIFTTILGAKAQSGAVTIKADPRVDSLLVLHVAHNQNYPFIQGYRIQLFKDSGNEALDAAHEIMDKFSEYFPEYKTYLSFQEPYYRVRVGDFRTRLEALEAMEKIKKKYRNVWIIKDNINLFDYQNNQN